MLLFVPEYKIEKLFAKIKRLNRRAEKLGLPLITYRQTGQEKLQKEEIRYEGFSMKPNCWIGISIIKLEFLLIK